MQMLLRRALPAAAARFAPLLAAAVVLAGPAARAEGDLDVDFKSDPTKAQELGLSGNDAALDPTSGKALVDGQGIQVDEAIKPARDMDVDFNGAESFDRSLDAFEPERRATAGGPRGHGKGAAGARRARGGFGEAAAYDTALSFLQPGAAEAGAEFRRAGAESAWGRVYPQGDGNAVVVYLTSVATPMDAGALSQRLAASGGTLVAADGTRLEATTVGAFPAFAVTKTLADGRTTRIVMAPVAPHWNLVAVGVGTPALLGHGLERAVSLPAWLAPGATDELLAENAKPTPPGEEFVEVTEDVAPICAMGADGKIACGYNCKMGADGHTACADAPAGACEQGASGSVTCVTGFPASPGADQVCATGADGTQACGYRCQMGATGKMACANTENGACMMQPDGEMVCSQVASTTITHKVARQRPPAPTFGLSAEAVASRAAHPEAEGEEEEAGVSDFWRHFWLNYGWSAGGNIQAENSTDTSTLFFGGAWDVADSHTSLGIHFQTVGVDLDTDQSPGADNTALEITPHYLHTMPLMPNLNLKLSGGPNITRVFADDDEVSGFTLGIGLRAGVEYQVSENFDIGADLRYAGYPGSTSGGFTFSLGFRAPLVWGACSSAGGR